MQQNEHEEWIVDELVKYSIENTTHLTKRCFEQEWYYGEKASVSATKFFYSSLFNKPEEARCAIDRILETPYEYQVESFLQIGYDLSVLYQNMIEREPGLDKLLKDTYQQWITELDEDTKRRTNVN